MLQLSSSSSSRSRSKSKLGWCQARVKLGRSWSSGNFRRTCSKSSLQLDATSARAILVPSEIRSIPTDGARSGAFVGGTFRPIGASRVKISASTPPWRATGGEDRDVSTPLEQMVLLHPPPARYVECDGATPRVIRAARVKMRARSTPSRRRFECGRRRCGQDGAPGGDPSAHPPTHEAAVAMPLLSGRLEHRG